jgi:hypothetical protein
MLQVTLLMFCLDDTGCIGTLYRQQTDAGTDECQKPRVQTAEKDTWQLEQHTQQQAL